MGYEFELLDMLRLPVIRRSKGTEATETHALETSFTRMVKWLRSVAGRGPERKSTGLGLRPSVSVWW